MPSTRTGNRGPRLVLGVALIVAFLTLAGCSTTAASPTHKPAHAEDTPTPQKTDSSYTIEDTTGGFVYTDAPSGYAVTFPQRPDVEPLANNETDQAANYASFVRTDVGRVCFDRAGPQQDAKSPGPAHGGGPSMNPSGQVSASSYTLGGLDAAQAQFTTGEQLDDSE